MVQVVSRLTLVKVSDRKVSEKLKSRLPGAMFKSNKLFEKLYIGQKRVCRYIYKYIKNNYIYIYI